ncbi:aldo/keto reductase [Devosia sp. J2-20]|jgi:aryl-alcohol dehydrogenase-like predicted oxidoreductase|uniref:aldo/keto reductase n=1 Tax=Devosia TaxID=46913 RepID=UPI0022B067E1|nr:MULTISPECIES: aldo/keto reductase [Devosia]MCZ4347668.1 aldo/keto reductase [Devosia neptuniae]WDQ99945.1 aldo/keto reductase [Devosia sp. J2-20]|tara:strand:- start:43282 stop:44343 length:1062 start_codon:yes stop_codon:yes gene_type:complete
MEYRYLGRSGLKVSVLTMGTMTFGGSERVGHTDQADANRQIDLCLDAGINLLDTANVYNAGVSEEMIGVALRENGRRERALVATKVRFNMGDGPNEGGLSRHHIIAQAEASLRRLKTDVIDLYQVHEWDGQTPVEETMAALDTLVQHGKVRYIGCSNYSGWHIMKALQAADKRQAERFVSQQIHYTLHSREAEYELVPISQDQGLGMLIWSPLAGGLLSGKYRRDGGPQSGRHVGGFREPPVYDWDKLYDIVDVIVAIADARGVSGAQVALAWTLGRPGVTSVIIGGRSQAQFEDNLAAADLKLSAEERARLDAVSQPPLIYPYWHQTFTANDRLGPVDADLLAPYVEEFKRG